MQIDEEEVTIPIDNKEKLVEKKQRVRIINDGLTYVNFGFFHDYYYDAYGDSDNGVSSHSMFVVGQQTPLDSMPAFDTKATYKGDAFLAMGNGENSLFFGKSRIDIFGKNADLKFYDFNKNEYSQGPADIHIKAKVKGNQILHSPNYDRYEVRASFFGPNGEEISGNFKDGVIKGNFGAKKQ